MSLEVADTNVSQSIVDSPHMSLMGPNFIAQGEPIRLRFNGGGVTDPFEVRILIRYRFVGEPTERTWSDFIRA